MKLKIIKKDGLKESHFLKAFYLYLKENDIKEVHNIDDSDLVVTFGGDGTILAAAQKIIDKDIPVLPVHMGSLGYLAYIKDSEAVYMLNKFMNNEYETEERKFLEVRYNDTINYALNELVIAKGGLKSTLVVVSAYTDEVLINKYRADGIIVATPTGSTAYSLSAGGPIVHPSLNSVLLTPLAPQSLNARPIVVDGSRILSFKLDSRDNDIHLNIDGQLHFKISKDDKIEAQLSNKVIKLIKPEKRDYFMVLREKLKWGETI